MSVLGPFTLLDKALGKVMNDAGPIDLTTVGGIKAVLATSAQAIDHSFVGASGDARYADLTAELATANGYTAGGVALAGLAITALAANLWQWSASSWSWTLTGSITFKYLLLYDSSAPNKDLLAFCDMDTGGGSITATAGLLQFSPANGIFKWTQ